MVVIKRNPDKTRKTLLQAAFYEIYEHGFQAASIESIIKEANVTKGALYHHFKNKMELGYAVVTEVIKPYMIEKWSRPLLEATNPIDVMIEMAKNCADLSAEAQECRLGCPLNNLSQEMSPLDEGFRLRLNEVFDTWRSIIFDAIKRGQENGYVRKDIDPDEAAQFLIVVVEGSATVAKNTQNPDSIKAISRGLIPYFESLRA